MRLTRVNWNTTDTAVPGVREITRAHSPQIGELGTTGHWNRDPGHKGSVFTAEKRHAGSDIDRAV